MWRYRPPQHQNRRTTPVNTSLPPSTDWREDIPGDEAQRFAAYAPLMADIQARKSAKFGKGRTLHRKGLAAAKGHLEVLADLPAFAAQGVFAVPRTFDATVRLSNGGFDRAADRTPDIRGFAIRLQGVEGESALGGPATSQDFLLINHAQFSFPKSAEFVDFLAAASYGPGALLAHLVRRYGLVGGTSRIIGFVKTMGQPFGGFATEPLFSAVPMACGPYAVRSRIVPNPSNGVASADARNGWGDDFARRLAQQALSWDVQLQPFVREDITPIEDASVNWPSPYTTVARLVLPQQDLRADAAVAIAADAEAGSFDPWHALAAHRPLGDVQRARKGAYFASQQARGAT